MGAKTCFISDWPQYSSHDARWRTTKVFTILTRHNQLSNSWTKRLTWSLKLSMKNSLRRIKLNYNENVAKQSTRTQWKWRQTKSKYSRWCKHLCQAKVRLEIGFGLFRIIFTLPKLKQKELALNSKEMLQLKWNCTHHFIEHGRAYIKILFMTAQ